MSHVFAKNIVHLYLFMKSQNEYVLSRQLLKSDTSFGANIEEAQGAQSKRDFIAKMQISERSKRNKVLAPALQEYRIFRKCKS
ncbi:four helix bundle protein [Membranicola marinus]|uniref:Four helix bundle protein n=1 Tax=Membranihabitans marinus TaxID=1227546 RepID=A0A953HR46_9BACT|nr:four helix bundle protein [Membranihabitans marinus]